MTVEYNGNTYTRWFRILLEFPDGDKATYNHRRQSFQHPGKNVKQTCIGFFDILQKEGGERSENGTRKDN